LAYARIKIKTATDFFIRQIPCGKKIGGENLRLFYRGTQFDAIKNFLSGCVASFVLIGISNKCLPPIPSCIVNSVETIVD
jgi:hypothetical protein